MLKVMAPSRAGLQRLKSGRWYLPRELGSAATNGGMVAGVINLTACYIPERITVAAMGTKIGTVGPGGSCQLASYTHNFNTGGPGLLEAYTASMSTAVLGEISNPPIPTNIVLEEGVHWFALNADNATALFSVAGGQGTNYGAMIGSPVSAIGSGSAALVGLTTPGAFGTWPADLSGATFTGVMSKTPQIQYLVG
ncbi:hypothetical protein [Methylobacterium marchantiae]|uniref:Microcystin-dependent protein n=1 Tax=Methylobacterium marchantiae TaxID=600331 RepID=A0ABW3X3J9_9HYPH|nr:hypothetical protein AIGOOFII_3458 [Methylobacterium marchantiae]